MYIKTKTVLEEELSKREKRKKEIIEKTEMWIEKEFGIPNFYDLAKKIGIKSNGKPIGILPRHIPSTKIEDIMAYVGSKKLGIESVALSFGADQFSVTNWSKTSCLKMPFLERINKKIAIRSEYITANQKLSDLNGAPLNAIAISDGTLIIDFHKKLRENTFPEDIQMSDISNFFTECFHISMENKKIPSSIFVFQTKNGKQRKIKIENISSLDGIRPPMSWYYPLFFSLFLTDIVIFETYSNTPGAEQEFIKTMEMVSKAAGCKPMVIETPLNVTAENYTSKALLEYNKALLEKGAMQEFIEETENIDSDNILEIFEGVAKKALTFKI